MCDIRDARRRRTRRPSRPRPRSAPSTIRTPTRDLHRTLHHLLPWHQCHHPSLPRPLTSAQQRIDVIRRRVQTGARRLSRRALEIPLPRRVLDIHRRARPRRARRHRARARCPHASSNRRIDTHEARARGAEFPGHALRDMR